MQVQVPAAIKTEMIRQCNLLLEDSSIHDFKEQLDNIHIKGLLLLYGIDLSFNMGEFCSYKQIDKSNYLPKYIVNLQSSAKSKIK